MIRAADDGDFIARRLAEMAAERKAVDEAEARGCFDLSDGQKCSVSNCVKCREEAWAQQQSEPPLPCGVIDIGNGLRFTFHPTTFLPTSSLDGVGAGIEWVDLDFGGSDT